MVDVINMDPNLITILLAIACLFPGEAVRNERQTTDDNGSTICYEHLGCFEKDKSLFGINLFPTSPDTIDTKFRLFTRKNLNDTMFQLLSSDEVVSIQNSYFDSGKRTQIVVHGFIQHGLEPWMLTMKNELLKAGDFNVVLVDWGKGSMVGYDQAVANTRVVGAEIARLINVLKEQAVANPEDFHVIGHSLGAHIGGYAGERLPNLGRITGLDPAGLHFQDRNKIVRLDPTDAQFVDVIHTDGKSLALLGLGMKQPLGHVDYYPNGGLDQPGCFIFYVACSHVRAFEYFTESINSACPFLGFRCESYENFKEGGCMPCSGGVCGYMGFHADQVKPPAGTTNVKYFLDTGNSEPFCRHHYQIKVLIGSLSNSENGKVKINLIGSQGQLGEEALTNRNMDIEPGKTYGFDVTSINDLGTVNNVTVSWHPSTSTSSSSISIEKLKIVSGNSPRIASFFSQDATIEAGHTYYFTRKCG